MYMMKTGLLEFSFRELESEVYVSLVDMFKQHFVNARGQSVAEKETLL
jgi:hypothetical protein